MTTPARDYTENSSIGVSWRTPISDQVENLSRDSDMAIEDEDWYRSSASSSRFSASSRLIRVGAAAGLVFVLAVIGSAAAMAWRAHIELPVLARRARSTSCHTTTRVGTAADHATYGCIAASAAEKRTVAISRRTAIIRK